MERLLMLFPAIVVVSIAFAAVSAARRDLRVAKRCHGHSPCCHCCGNDRPAP